MVRVAVGVAVMVGSLVGVTVGESVGARVIGAFGGTSGKHCDSTRIMIAPTTISVAGTRRLFRLFI